MYKIFRVKMLPTVKFDGAPKHDKMCSKPHSQSMGPYQKEITGETFKFTLFLVSSNSKNGQHINTNYKI